MSVTFYGIGGANYESIEEAWTSYFENLYGSIDVMSSQEYHSKYLDFVSGILCGMNIVYTRFDFLNRQQGVPDGTAIQRAMLTLTNEAMEIAAEEYQQSRRKK